jgi:hypothetical protein
MRLFLIEAQFFGKPLLWRSGSPKAIRDDYEFL